MSIPLSENVQIGPKVSIFFVAIIIFKHCLTLLGMEFTRASQVATRVLFHSSMMTSLSWWLIESFPSSTFHLRMPHRCSIGCRSGGHACPVHHLYPQLAAMLAALISLYPKHNLWYTAEHVHSNFFGRPWWGLFWVEPVLLKNCCMVLATMLQPVSGSWQSSCSLRHLYVEQRWTFSDQYERGESENTKCNTPAPHSPLTPCNTNESHDTGERKWLIGLNLGIFT